MDNPKTKSLINYTYSVGDMIVHGSTSSNYVEPFIRDVVINIKKNCNVQYFKPGDVLTYTITVANVGTYLSEFINISEEILHQNIIADSIKVSSINDIDFMHQDSVNGIDFIIKKLNPHESIHITYQTIVDEIINPNQNIISTSEIEVDDQELIYSTPIEIQQKFARILCEAESSPYIYPNQPYQYILTVSNIGNCSADDVEISSQIPYSYELDSVYIDDEVCDVMSINNNILKFMIGEVDPNDSKIITITGKIVR